MKSTFRYDTVKGSAEIVFSHVSFVAYSASGYKVYITVVGLKRAIVLRGEVAKDFINAFEEYHAAV